MWSCARYFTHIWIKWNWKRTTGKQRPVIANITNYREEKILTSMYGPDKQIQNSNELWLGYASYNRSPGNRTNAWKSYSVLRNLHCQSSEQWLTLTSFGVWWTKRGCSKTYNAVFSYAISVLHRYCNRTRVLFRRYAIAICSFVNVL